VVERLSFPPGLDRVADEGDGVVPGVIHVRPRQPLVEVGERGPHPFLQRLYVPAMKPTKNQTLGLQVFGRGGHAGASISSRRPGGPWHPPRVSRLQMRGTISGWTALGWAIAYVALGLVEDLPGGETLGLAGWFDGVAHLGATALLAALIMVWRE